MASKEKASFEQVKAARFALTEQVRAAAKSGTFPAPGELTAKAASLYAELGWTVEEVAQSFLTSV